MPHHAKRYHDLDALRAFAMLLGIVLHGMMSFICVPAWGAQDFHQNTPLYGTALYAIHGFRLPLFFLISGFFTMMLWKKRGTRGLVKHRLKHIGLPLIIFTIVIWPVLIAASYWGLSSKMKRDAFGRFPANQEIWQAAVQGHVETILKHLESGVHVDTKDILRTTALSYAAMHNRPAAIDLLLERGANINASNSQGMTALHFAALFGHVEAVQKLVAKGASPNRRNLRGRTPLEMAHSDLRGVRIIAVPFTVQVDVDTFQMRQSQIITFLLGRTSARPLDSWSRVKARGYTLAVEMPVFVHLWFLYYLLLILCLFLVAVALHKRLPIRFPDWMVATPTCFLWLLPLTFASQSFMTQSFGADTAAGLVPWPPKLAYYATFFLYGAMAYGRPAFEQAGRHWKTLFLLAIPTLISGITFYRQSDFIYSSALAVTYAWLMIFCMIGFFQALFSTPRPWVRYLSDSSYWLYIAHIPLILVPQILLSEMDLPNLLKFVLISLSTFTVLLLSYAYLVRHTFVGKLLNGRKHPRPQ